MAHDRDTLASAQTTNATNFNFLKSEMIEVMRGSSLDILQEPTPIYTQTMTLHNPLMQAKVNFASSLSAPKSVTIVPTGFTTSMSNSAMTHVSMDNTGDHIAPQQWADHAVTCSE